MALLVKDYMTKNPVVIKEEEPVSRVGELLNTEKFRHLPVVNDQQEVVGMISDRDLRNIQTALDFVRDVLKEEGEKLRVKDIMHATPITISPDSSLKEAAQLINQQKIGALIVTEGSKIAGILSYTDILRAFIENFPN